MNINQLLALTIEKNASDLHILVGDFPTLRVNGELTPISGSTKVTKEDMDTFTLPLLNFFQKEILNKNLELDFGIDFEHKARFRVNIYKQRGTFAIAFRLIPITLRKLEELGLPQVVANLTQIKQGLVLVTGPTGQGKSTTLAAFINHINMTRAAHIITIEDPIEYVYPAGKSLISQRELNSDTHSFGNALKSALREDPDVVLIGEMRDLETISTAMTVAETGHLVFATLHTNSAAQTVDRIIDVFPVNQQPQIRVQFAAVIEAIISQRLVPTITPGRVVASEILFGTPALRSVIRDGKTHLIDNMIQTSAEAGMVSLEGSLANLVKSGKITAEVARNYSLRPQVLQKLMGIN